MNEEIPRIDYQLFVEMCGTIDFLVLVRTPDVEWLNEQQMEAIYQRALSLPTNFDKKRTAVVMVDKRGIRYWDGTSNAESPQDAEQPNRDSDGH